MNQSNLRSIEIRFIRHALREEQGEDPHLPIQVALFCLNRLSLLIAGIHDSSENHNFLLSRRY